MANVTVAQLTVDDGVVKWEDATIISTAAGNHAVLTFDKPGGGAGDAMIRYQIGSSTKFTAGLDDSVNDDYYFAVGGDLGTNNVYGITSAGDITFYGASYNVQWDKSDNSLEFKDGASVKFGNAPDMTITHSSNQNTITLANDLNITGANVGIGTDAPTEELEVVGGANSTIQSRSTTGAAQIRIDATTDAYLIMQRGDTSKWALINDYTGTDEFSIYNYNNSTNNMKISTAGDWYFYNNNIHDVGNTNSNWADGVLTVQAEADAAVIIAKGSSGNMAAQFGSTNNDEGYMDLADGGSTKVRIAANLDTYFNGGDVGIGTASPAARLHVETAAISSQPLLYVKNAFYNTTKPIVHFENTNSNNGQKPLVQIETAASTNDQPALAVLNGYVGIGTASPATYLNIVGDGSSVDLLRVQMSGGSGNFWDVTCDNSGSYMGFDDYLYIRPDNTTAKSVQITTTAVTLMMNTYQSAITSSPHLILDRAAVGNNNSWTSIKFRNSYNYSNENWYIGSYGHASDNALRRFSIANHAGTEVFTVNYNGNVGIGTDAPQKTLHVKNTSGVAQLRLDYNGAYSEMFFNADMYFQPSGTTKMTIKADGKVGIGTTTPNNELHVHDSGGGNIRFQLTNATSGSGTGDGFRLRQDATTTYIENQEAGSMYFYTSGMEAGYIDSSRYWHFSGSGANFVNGVNFASTGRFAATGKDTSSPATAIASYHLTFYPPDATGYYGNNIGFSEGANVAAFISSFDEGSGGALGLSFGTGSNSAVAERMRIDESGNIGAASGTNIYNASDKRLKRNIIDLTDSLTIINQLQGVSFNWIEGFSEPEEDKTLYGFIAQDVDTVDTNLVESFGQEGSIITVNGVDIPDALRVNEKFIIPLLVEAIKELKAEIDIIKKGG